MAESIIYTIFPKIVVHHRPQLDFHGRQAEPRSYAVCPAENFL
jgi:hypothetical protein